MPSSRFHNSMASDDEELNAMHKDGDGFFEEEEEEEEEEAESAAANVAIASAPNEVKERSKVGTGGKFSSSALRSAVSSARTAPSVVVPGKVKPQALAPSLRRSPSPSIGASSLRKPRDNAPRSTSVARSSSGRSASPTSSNTTMELQNSVSNRGIQPYSNSQNIYNPKSNSKPTVNLNLNSESYPKTNSKMPVSNSRTAQVNFGSPVGAVKQFVRSADDPISPAAKDGPPNKLVLEGSVKPITAARKGILRSSAGAELISGVTSRRHSLSSTPVQGVPLTPGRRKSDPRLLQHIESKAGEDVRLDLRGQNIWRLDSNHINLTPKLEFVYLRDTKLSSMNGLEVLRRVKVLDLSFNDFKGGGFEPLANCKTLQQLYLAGNQISSLSGLPQLPSLEFLSVAQNKLKSLIMSPQPKLQVLAASNNKISTFKGFPHLPVLEHLRLEENPILDIAHAEAASILVVGATLKRFNNQDLCIEEQKLALLYPAHTALCLREGWDFCDVEEASESTLQFLVAQWKEKLPPGFTVKKASIDPPSEEDCCSCCFILEEDSDIQEDVDLTLTYQWFVGDKTATNFSPIEGAFHKTYWPKHQDIGRCLKVECTPAIREAKYPSIFAISSPVTAGTGCPKVLSLRVHGELIEGKIIQAHAEVAWCGGTPGKGIVSWLRRRGGSSPVSIMGAEDHNYQLNIDDVGSNLLLMYTPVTEEGVKGESQFATTPVILAASPSVKNVQVIGPFIEGTTIKGTGRYFGGREGLSKFEWLREDVQSGEFKLASRGSAEYLLSKEDVGLCLMFIYTPVNVEGIQGDPVSAMTAGKVLVAPPKATHLKILGDIREGNIVSISASIVGGLEDVSRVQWFKTMVAESSVDEASLEAISSSKVAKDFRIPVGAVRYYLAAKYTPARLDGDCGEPVLVVSDQRVEMLPPSLTFLSVNGEATEGETLTASYGYIGGHEGKSEYSWYLHKDESDLGVPIPSANGLLQYKITSDAVNKLLSFRCMPVREDGISGEPRSTMVQEFVRPGLPMLMSLHVGGDPMEGAVLHIDKKYWGGFEGASNIQWLLKKPNGPQHEIKDATLSTYRVRTEDIDGLISVSCEPIRSDGVKGSIVVSQALGPVLPGFPSCDSVKIVGQPVEGGSLSFEVVYKGGEMGPCISEWYRKNGKGKEDWLSNSERLDLTSKDVGSHILLVFTPVRKDGLTGASFQVLSDVVMNADPVGVNISIPDCFEGVEVVPRKLYYGGTEGFSEYKWFSVQHGLCGATLPDDAIILANTLTYIPSREDVGMHIALSWTPVRADGKKGTPLLACSEHPVAPALPSVSNLIIKKIGTWTLLGHGDYHGGFEGESKVSWYREHEGVLTLIEGGTSKTYNIAEEDYTHSLVFAYTPVREDGVKGAQVFSERSPTILPDIPRPQKLILSGKASESEVLVSTGIMFENEVDQAAWHKYKKDVKYQWLRSTGPGAINAFETLPLQRTSSYKVRSEDVGYILRCECTMADIFGRLMEPVAVMTSPVLPGVPKMDKLEIEGRGYHTNLYAVRGIYSGGKEGKSLIQWFRAVSGRPDLIPIIGEVGRMYEANVDDIGCRLVAVYTPIREDGVGGAPVSASTEPIAVEPEIAREVKQKLELGAVKFEALRDRDQPSMKGLGSLERRVLDVNKKRYKVVKPGSKTSFPNTEIRGSYASPFHVEIIQNDQHRLKIIVDSENEVDLMVQTRNLRDVIVLVLRGFAHRFNGAPAVTMFSKP